MRGARKSSTVTGTALALGGPSALHRLEQTAGSYVNIMPRSHPVTQVANLMACVAYAMIMSGQQSFHVLICQYVPASHEYHPVPVFHSYKFGII